MKNSANNKKIRTWVNFLFLKIIWKDFCLNSSSFFKRKDPLWNKKNHEFVAKRSSFYAWTKLIVCCSNSPVFLTFYANLWRYFAIFSKFLPCFLFFVSFIIFYFQKLSTRNAILTILDCLKWPNLAWSSISAHAEAKSKLPHSSQLSEFTAPNSVADKWGQVDTWSTTDDSSASIVYYFFEK